MITSDEIISIVQNILSTMLQQEAVPSDLNHCENRSDRVNGCVQISGQWQGAVVIQSSEKLAQSFGGRLFDCPVDNLSESELRDAYAELTNMIGGNIKGQVPGPSFLSIPSVTTGQDFDFHLAGASIILDVALDCDGETLRIMLCEGDSAQSRRLTQRLAETSVN